jgi:membrane dipeptidase
MKRSYWVVGGVGVTLLVAAVVFFGYLPVRHDAQNLVIAHEPYPVSPAAQALHDTIHVADLHADPLLRKRDIVKRNNRGHTDIPRLIEGGFALQVFSVVTKSPKGANYVKNAGDSDTMTWRTVRDAWPPRTWDSLIERALYLAWKLEDAGERSGGALRVVRTRSDLRAALNDQVLAGVLLSEGAHPLEGKLENLERMYDAGFRVLALQHFFDNDLGGSLHGQSQAGLTEFGKSVVAAAEAKGMLIDVAHSSEASARDALAIAKKPMIVSHTGIKGHCDTPRNVSDELMKEIAAAGGLIGVGFWDAAVCEPTLEKVTEAIVYAVQLLGAEHVALGSDFDGGIPMPFDASEMAALTSSLLDAGLDEETIRLVMGENIIRLFATHLPEN